mmetsp:Transcript_38765/g.91534  ORF Transcript_38765/g.91534 Transcript_38765/m.91534 type:complete len:485 (-) Transcript_38765:978-2432(-)
MEEPPRETEEATMERARRLERASLRRSSMLLSMLMYLSLSMRMRSILNASIDLSHAAKERPSVCFCQFPMSFPSRLSRVLSSRVFIAPPEGSTGAARGAWACLCRASMSSCAVRNRPSISRTLPSAISMRCPCSDESCCRCRSDVCSSSTCFLRCSATSKCRSASSFFFRASSCASNSARGRFASGFCCSSWYCRLCSLLRASETWRRSPSSSCSSVAIVPPFCSASCTAARFCAESASTSARSEATARRSSSSILLNSISFMVWALRALVFLASASSRLVFASSACLSLASKSATLAVYVRMYSAWLATLLLSSLMMLSLCPWSLGACSAALFLARASSSSRSVLLCFRFSTWRSSDLVRTSPPAPCSRRVESSSWAILSSDSSFRKRASLSSVLERMPSRKRMNFSRKASWLRWRSRSSSFRRRRSPDCLSTSACSSSTFARSRSFSKSGSVDEPPPDGGPTVMGLERIGSGSTGRGGKYSR